MPEVTPQQHALFEEQGHVVIGPILPPADVARLRQAFEAQAAAWAAEIDTPLDDYLAVVSQWTNVWEHNPVFREQLYHQRAAAIAAELIGCQRVRVFHDHLIVKPPHGGSTVPWHRDLPNWPVAEPRAVSCWLALDDVTAESGAMRFMPGGHREPVTRSIDFLNEAKVWGERERDAVPVAVPAGSAVFHHCLSWHTSPPNSTAGWRRAYITIYLDATCTYDPTRAAWHPMAGRVSVPAGATFNEDVFPTLGPGLSAAHLATLRGGAA
ncbi:MAG: phytanoyl-CoA dioxygenase family protein [Myxococcales bacterium]|nr:phytanoyl-CoA dioxygenase family protein [Myxococcales bacterium]